MGRPGTGDPNNLNRLYAAVTAPNAAANASTAIYVSNDNGATWTQTFGAAQSGGTIQGASQTVIKIATAPAGLSPPASSIWPRTR